MELGLPGFRTLAHTDQRHTEPVHARPPSETGKPDVVGRNKLFEIPGCVAAVRRMAGRDDSESQRRPN